MYLREMKTLPKKAGKARLQFGYRGKKVIILPFRQNDRIILPSLKSSFGAEFYPLSKVRQFLFVCGHVWFGGTDENVFLVRLDKEVYGIFCAEGEKAFFEALRPIPIKMWEEYFGKTQKIKRQGDIWAMPLKLSWQELKKSAFIFCEGFKIKVEKVKNRSILGTRHALTGYLLLDIQNIDSGGVFTNIMIGEGTLKSPNHKPIKIKGPHLLTQTDHLLSGAD